MPTFLPPSDPRAWEPTEERLRALYESPEFQRQAAEVWQAYETSLASLPESVRRTFIEGDWDVGPPPGNE